MNIQERKNLTYRLIAALILFITAGMVVFSFIVIIKIETKQLFLDILTLSLVSLFLLVEEILILKGGKKESHLYKIAFEDNGKVNGVPIIAVGIGGLFGLGLVIMGVCVYFIRFDEVTIRTSMLVILSVAVYLLTNCIIYVLYLLMFRKREVRLEDLIK